VGMRYDPADGCGALWVGRFASAATLNGFLACGDGSTTAGLWGGRLLPP
jgi:hypothetical protein